MFYLYRSTAAIDKTSKLQYVFVSLVFIANYKGSLTRIYFSKL